MTNDHLSPEDRHARLVMMLMIAYALGVATMPFLAWTASMGAK